MMMHGLANFKFKKEETLFIERNNAISMRHDSHHM